MKINLLTWGSFALGLLAQPLQTLQAETPAEKGLAIATEINKRDTGFGDHSAIMTMTLHNKHGQSSARTMRLKTLEGLKDGDKTLVVFDNPRDVKGTAMLTFTHKKGSDDQWLYLPALKRVKRISSKNKSGPFMGSEFAFEDLTSQEVEKYTYKYIKEVEYEGQACLLVEFDPVDENSGYSRQQVWINREKYIVVKIDFYDRKNDLLKTLTMTGYKQYLDKFWRAEKFDMNNHQKRKRTIIEWKDYKFNNGFKDADFNRNSLKRAK